MGLPIEPTASSVHPAVAALSGGEFHFIYRRSVSAMNAGMTFSVEWSDSLPGTIWSTAGVTHAIISTHGAFETVRATLPTGPGATPRFARLRLH